MDLVHIALIATSWALYFGLHSLLAALGVKRWVARRYPAAVRAYRLTFNALALALLAPPLWLTFAQRGPYLWRWEGAAAWLANGLAALAALGFFWSSRYYDMREFMGFRQWREHAAGVQDQERLRISPLHRLVRHPWYTLGLAIIWTRDMDIALLTAAVMITLYFIVGSRLEERKLLVYHGEAYREYRRRVPALIPLPWRRLDKEAAARLTALAAQASSAGADGRHP